jgi:hypothetical protein
MIYDDHKLRERTFQSCDEEAAEQEPLERFINVRTTINNRPR